MKEWIRDIVIAILVAVAILQFIKPTIVKESSMEPTLYENHYIFLSRQAYNLFGDPQRGDIIVFDSDLPLDNGQTKKLIKRVIGLPGEHVLIQDGCVYIDEQLLTEPYIKDGTTSGYVDIVVPEGKLFCMGDNRLVSIDSRDERVGCVDEDRIVGKAVFRLYPFKLFGPASGWVDNAGKARELAGDTPVVANDIIGGADEPTSILLGGE